MEIDEGYSNVISTVCLFRAPYNTGASHHSGYSVETHGLAEAGKLQHHKEAADCVLIEGGWYGGTGGRLTGNGAP